MVIVLDGQFGWVRLCSTRLSGRGGERASAVVQKPSNGDRKTSLYRIPFRSFSMSPRYSLSCKPPTERVQAMSTLTQPTARSLLPHRHSGESCASSAAGTAAAARQGFITSSRASSGNGMVPIGAQADGRTGGWADGRKSGKAVEAEREEIHGNCYNAPPRHTRNKKEVQSNAVQYTTQGTVQY